MPKGPRTKTEPQRKHQKHARPSSSHGWINQITSLSTANHRVASVSKCMPDMLHETENFLVSMRAPGCPINLDPVYPTDCATAVRA